MQTLKCKNCGTQFLCGSSADRHYWRMNRPNIIGGFDLADSCLWPDCMIKRQAKAITRQLKTRRTQRQGERTLLW